MDMFTKKTAPTPMHAKGQPRPGGAVNQGGQWAAPGQGSTTQLPSKSTGTMKKSASASKGFLKAQQPMQDGNIPPSLAGLVRH